MMLSISSVAGMTTPSAMWTIPFLDRILGLLILAQFAVTSLSCDWVGYMLNLMLLLLF